MVTSSSAITLSADDPVHTFPAIVTFPIKTWIFARVAAARDGALGFQQATPPKSIVSHGIFWSLYTAFKSKREGV